ncbi:MAG: DUF4350 domain-containing protein [Proteobacteria bacterium]|nr:DUF4350 domain-containing protein [Pseudomonadota bacterium]
MRERLITLGCALGALALFVTLFWRGGGAGDTSAALPTSIERAENGLYGAFTWLQRERVPVVSLRERYTAIRGMTWLAPSGNLLIVSLPVTTPVRNTEIVDLDRWIRRGNSLLVLSPLRDRPRYAMLPGAMEGNLSRLTGLAPVLEGSKSAPAAPAKPVTKPPEKAAAPAPAKRAIVQLSDELDPPREHFLVPTQPSRYFDGVKHAVGFSDNTPRPAKLAIGPESLPLTLAREGGADAFWMRADGDGTILVSGFATVFSNRALAREGNAKLLSNIVANSLGPRGAVIFDDEHQGLTAAYDPAKFYRDPRLFRTLAVIAIVWLIWVLGGTTLKAPLRRAPLAREDELVRITGSFLARVLRPATAAQRMFTLFLARLRTGSGRTDDPAAVWDWLDSHPALAREDVRQLRDWYQAAYQARRVPLIRLHNLMLETERRLAA